ncbi:MAG: hypothetical protein H9535_08750 [Ignavibacteria bacterium]|nr:hypothetical protein [Ignavibacteria bacterium]
MHKFISSFLILLALCFSSASAQDKKQALQSFFTRIQFPDSNAKEFDRVELLQLYNSVSQKNYSTKKQECDNILDLYKQKLLNQSGNVALAKKYKSLLQSFTIPWEQTQKDLAHKSWELVARDYTLENMNELYTTTGINAFAVMNYGQFAESTVLRNSLIVIGRIDSIFTGDFNDFHQVSYSVSISKVLKGDKSLKNVIIRTDDEELVTNGNGNTYIMSYNLSYHFPSHLEKLIVGQEYLLCLSKLEYERKVTQLQLASEQSKQEYQFRNDKITQEKRNLCYARNVSLQLSQSNNEQSTDSILQERAKRNKKSIQEIQDLCKKLSNFFEKMNRENTLPNQH